MRNGKKIDDLIPANLYVATAAYNRVTAEKRIPENIQQQLDGIFEKIDPEIMRISNEVVRASAQYVQYQKSDEPQARMLESAMMVGMSDLNTELQAYLETCDPNVIVDISKTVLSAIQQIEAADPQMKAKLEKTRSKKRNRIN